MKLLPHAVHKFESDAEKRIFNLLKDVNLGPGAVAFHSLNLSEHEYKEWAEADFVIISAKGILVLEVKGGGVSRAANGIWEFTNRYGEVHRKSESPFEQAKTARYALKKLLLKKGGMEFVEEVNFGWGCIFPDTRFDLVETVEINSAMLLDSKLKSADDLKHWLDDLYKYWNQKKKKRRPLKIDDIALLTDVMRPAFDLVPPLSVRVRNVLERQLSLTKAQYSALDFLLANPRAVVTGGAGTGKTVLAMEACRRISSNDGKPLLICRNRMLADLFKRELKGTNASSMHIDQLLDAMERGLTPKFTHLVIDEGQDILDLEIVTKLDEIIPGGIIDGQWTMFMDVNNQGSMYGAIDGSVLDMFTSCASSCPLYKNIRNTPEICRHLTWYTGVSEPEMGELGYSVEVDDNKVYASREELANIVDKQLEDWLADDDIAVSDITILSPCSLPDSIVPFLKNRWKTLISELSENSSAANIRKNISFAQIRDFKGLDSPLVLLVDLEYLDEDDNGNVQLYVGMSRANAVLVMPIPRSKRRKFNRAKEANAQFENTNLKRSR